MIVACEGIHIGVYMEVNYKKIVEEMRKVEVGENGNSRACTLDCGYGEVPLHHGLAHAVHRHPGEVCTDGHTEHGVPLRRIGVHAAGRV